MENSYLAKSYHNLYFARLADTCGRFAEALRLIQQHFLQGFDPSKVKNNDLRLIEKPIKFDIEETETLISITKNFVG